VEYPRGVRLEQARHRLADDWALIAFYRTDTQSFFLTHRTVDAEPFYAFYQRAAIGIERTLGGGFTIDSAPAGECSQKTTTDGRIGSSRESTPRLAR